MKEQAVIKKSGKGWLLTFNNGTSMTIHWHNLPEEIDGQEIEVFRENGHPREIYFEGKQYRKEKSMGSKQSIHHQKKSFPKKYSSDADRKTKQDHGKDPARAPYNFVPLNEKIVPSNGKVNHSVFENLSGYIDVKIESKTPIFIRGKNENFFSVNNFIKIPGSSLRGMIRQLVEVFSYSKFNFFENNRLYVRSIAEPTSHLKNYYNKRKDEIEAGYLRYNKNDKTYCILPCNSEPERTSPTKEKFKYKKEKSGWIVNSGNLGKPKKQWIFPLISQIAADKEMKLEVTDLNDYQNDKMRDAKGPMADILKEAKKDKYPNGLPIFFSKYEDEDGKERIAVGHTKYFRIPYHLTIKDHIIQNDTSFYDFPSTIFGDTEKLSKVFFEDAELSERVDSKASIPHILSSPKPTTFQHYLEQPKGYKTIRKEQSHWGTSNTLIRGYKEYWHRKTDKDKKNNWRNLETPISRRAFESYLIYKNEYETIEEIVNKFGNYLEVRQAQILIKGDYHKLPIILQEFLYELFFHKPQTAKQYNLTKPQSSPISPLPTGTRFNGRIRFENLTKAELGALLFVLDLPSGCLHKLGMGKPLGLGSVEIKPALTLINRKMRYTKLFDDDGTWNLSETKESDLEQFKDAFAKYIGETMGLTSVTDARTYWENDERMQALKEMLTFEHVIQEAVVDWLDRTRYQDLNEFNDRPVLPEPSEVIQKNLYKKP